MPSCSLHPGEKTICPSDQQAGVPLFGRSRTERLPPATGNVEVDAHKVIGNFQDDTLLFQGDVTVRQGDRTVQGDDFEYNRHNNSVKTDSRIEFTDPLLKVIGDQGGSYSPEQGGDFKGAEFDLQTHPGRGRAESMWWTPEGVLRMENVTFTTCPANQESWRINASSVRLDTNSKTGLARNATVDFGGIPVFYLPVLSFPISNERKSGFLFPLVGQTSQSGVLISTPYYFNIAPNLDLTFEPTYYSRRNVDLGGDFRYLTESSHGDLMWNFLPHDTTYDTQYNNGRTSQRSRIVFNNISELPAGFRVTLRGENVSDSHYFEDFAQGPEGTATAFLDRAALLSYRDEHWRFDAEAEQFQTVDPTLPLEEHPYARLPRVALDGTFSAGPRGLLTYGFDSEAVRFQRNNDDLTAFPVPPFPTGSVFTTGAAALNGAFSPCFGIPGTASGPGCLVNGWRFTAEPRAQLNIDGAGYFLHPAVAYSATQYDLEDSAIGAGELTPVPGARRNFSPTRTLPIASVDTGLVLERSLGKADEQTMTLEPRLMYLYVPYRNQDRLPLFDTALPDLNPIQLFRENRFVGGDRFGDANQVTAGITSRLLNNSDGTQYLSGTIGQAFYFTPQRVFVPGQSFCASGNTTMVTSNESPLASECISNTRSDFIAQFQLTAWRRWSADYGLQYDSHLGRAVREYANLQYKRDSTAVLNLSYRYELNSVDQVEVSTAWPISRSFNILLREIYSLRSETVLTQVPGRFPNSPPAFSPMTIPPKSLETFAGIEYRSCCYGIRLGGRQFVNTFNTTTNHSRESTGVFLEVELMGFASVGSASDTVLMENIRGYVPPNARVPQNFIPPAFP